MDKEKHMVGKITLAMLTILTMWAVNGQRPCEALSLELTGISATQAIGTVGASATWTSSSSPDSWTVKNNSGATESIAIKVQTSVWSPGSSVAYNQFKLTAYKSAGGSVVLTTADQTIFLNLANNGTQKFGLVFNAPTGTSTSAQQTLTVTLTAVAACGGYPAAQGGCWYAGGDAQSCTTVCSSHGGCVTGPHNLTCAQQGAMMLAIGLTAQAPGYTFCQYGVCHDAGLEPVEQTSYGQYYNCNVDVYGQPFYYDPAQGYTGVRRACACAN